MRRREHDVRLYKIQHTVDGTRLFNCVNTNCTTVKCSIV